MSRRVVVCPEPLAAEAGAEIFRQGGSAVDAALATAYAQCVVSPVMASIAGTGGMNVFHAPTGRHVVLDFLGRAGSRCAPEMYVGRPPAEQQRGYRSILVPSFVRGTQVAFEQFGSGRVTWATILEPAIRYAEEGFAQYPYIHQYWRREDPVQQTRDRFDGYEMVTTTAASAAIFTVGDRVHFLGEQIVQKDLARTLRRLADVGPDDFYTGEIGRQIAADLEQNAAPITPADLVACRAGRRTAAVRQLPWAEHRHRPTAKHRAAAGDAAERAGGLRRGGAPRRRGGLLGPLCPSAVRGAPGAHPLHDRSGVRATAV